MTLCPGVRFIHLRLWSRLNRGRVFFICVYFSCFFRDKFEQIFEGQGTSTGKNPTFLEIIHILCKYCNYCKGWKIRTWNYFGYLCSRAGNNSCLLRNIKCFTGPQNTTPSYLCTANNIGFKDSFIETKLRFLLLTK